MQLETIDWIVVAVSLLICFTPALSFRKRSGKSSAEFFACGRAVPWWLAGVSMVATTFSSDTPNLVTNFVRTQGIAGNWQWWAFTLTGLATVFFFARLWRRSEVLTDLEFYELRYSGKAAAIVRGFRAVYLGLLFNCLIMASVNLAACKIAGVLFGFSRWQTLLAVGMLNVIFAAMSGLWGVLVIDLIQFIIMMSGVLAAAWFAVNLPEIGGLGGLVARLSTVTGPGGIRYLDFFPDFRSNTELAVAVFAMPLAVQWWAVWYPGAEPGGGSYIAQRMLASRSENDALAGSLLFNFAHYVLRPWPWILVALASLTVFPTLEDIRRALPHVDPALIGHDIAYPAMLKFLPPGWLGLMVAGLIAANSSTILTHLNWGASYLVHDFYRRFVRPEADEKELVLAGRTATVFLFAASSLSVYALETAQQTFDLILQVGAGTGLLYILRWFWWRITAWCEIAAMVSSFLISVALLASRKAGLPLDKHQELLLTVAGTTLCWLAVAFFGPQSDTRTLATFYAKVRPFGPGWRRFARQAAAGGEPTNGERENFPLALFGWISGTAAVWSALCLTGSLLFGRIHQAAFLGAVFTIAAISLAWVVRRLWR